ncbi:MAG: cob(I)yrinic acid a,c-diamide adenosyltransferase [Lachnospiraceae bacterium]|nr:cob(I)yrinic acid a,c-diamide adenosyltransferase [Lachnospiraceae bacterium]
MNMQTGLIHIYHGDGKGKTTAAVGLAVRAAGAGLEVCFAQFMKTGTSSELKILQTIENIELVAVKNSYGFTWKMTPDEKAHLKEVNDKELDRLIKAVQEGRYQLVILDELLSAYQNELIDKEKVITLINMAKQYKTELVLTGRNPAQELLDQADYITEMACVRHPYEKGVHARPGIEY